jgi:hypothetical protein
MPDVVRKFSAGHRQPGKASLVSGTGLSLAPTGGSVAHYGNKEAHTMKHGTLSPPDSITPDAVWDTVHPTVRQRFLQELISIAIRYLTQEETEPNDKEVLCRHH